MPSQPSKILDERRNDAAVYARDLLLLWKFTAIKKIASLLSRLTSLIMLLFLGFFIMLFGSLLLGCFLSILTGNFFIGFSFLTLAYIVVFILLATSRKQWIEKKLADKITRRAMKKKEPNG